MKVLLVALSTALSTALAAAESKLTFDISGAV
jgi:hypothetical protein